MTSLGLSLCFAAYTTYARLRFKETRILTSTGTLPKLYRILYVGRRCSLDFTSPLLKFTWADMLLRDYARRTRCAGLPGVLTGARSGRGSMALDVD